MYADPKSIKESQIKQLFALLGPAQVKALRKHNDEIDLWSRFRPSQQKTEA